MGKLLHTKFMNKQTYDTLILLGFQILNYPNETEPTWIKVKHPAYLTIAMVKPHDSLELIMREILVKIADVGYAKGKEDGKTELQGQFKTLMGL